LDKTKIIQKKEKEKPIKNKMKNNSVGKKLFWGTKPKEFKQQNTILIK